MRHRVLKYSEICFTRCRNFYSILPWRTLCYEQIVHHIMHCKHVPCLNWTTITPHPWHTRKKDKGLVVLLEPAALLSVLFFFFFHLILNNILHDIQALHSRATIYNFSHRQASERITVAPVGQWMEILRDGCYFGKEGKEVPIENNKKHNTK